MTDEQPTETSAEDEAGQSGGEQAGGESDAMASAKRAKEEEEKAKEKVKQLEDDLPERLEDWPDDKAKYETFGGPEGNESYEESVTSQLGPSGLRYREDGSVEVEGEKVDDPDEYKGEPIPGGPTDPRASETRAYGEPDLTSETSVDVEGEVQGEGEGETQAEGEGESSSSSDDASSDDGSEGG